ncbi:MAG: protein kinase, partial [candidate division Zixibacteria bacterium]|nr:protein kinase [candidate division Zixibacteria bacterium]
MNEASDTHDSDRSSEYVSLARGSAVSHYRIERQLGSGGMGEVYLAEDSELKRKVAVKFLAGVLTADAEQRARFTREAEAAASLNHPNIVTIYEVGEHRGRPFFVMEY